MLVDYVREMTVQKFCIVHIDRFNISRVPDQKGVSLLYIMLEIHHSGREPSICSCHICDETFCVIYQYYLCQPASDAHCFCQLCGHTCLLIHMSRWHVDRCVCNESSSAGQPGDCLSILCGKDFHVGHIMQTFQPNLFSFLSCLQIP